MISRCVYFAGPRRVEIRDEPVPDPGPGERLVRTWLSGISAGTEMLIYRGQMPEDLAADESIAALRGALRYPLKYGYAAVGEVGGGELVFSFQPHQGHFTAPEGDLLPVTAGLSAQEAVFIPNMETALGLVMDGAPLPGERVAVLGQGVVGLLTTAVLAGYPLALLAALDHYPLRRRTALELGAGITPGPDHVPQELLHSFDLVFELTGSPEALNAAISLAGEEGRIVVGSWYGSKRAPLDLGGHFHRGRLKLISSQVSRLGPALTGRWTKRRRLEFAMEMIRRVEPARLITQRFGVEEAAEAYRLIDERPEEVIQVVLEYE